MEGNWEQFRLDEFQEEFGLKIPLVLLQEALTHPSIREYQDGIRTNEQLETLGDAVLDLLVGHLLIQQDPDISSGDLTQARSALVNNRTLSKLGRHMRIPELLQITDGYTIGERDIANAVEAIFGAVFLNAGFAAAEAFFVQISEVLSQYSQEFTADNGQYYNPIGKLQEFAQKQKLDLPSYEIIDRRGPDHSPEFGIRGSISWKNQVFTATARGRSKKLAREKVAKKILDQLTQQQLL